MSSRHPGLSKEVWRAVLRRPIGVTFIAADLVDELPSLSNSDSPANVLRAIGAALKSLRLPANYGATLGVKKLLTLVPVGKPKKPLHWRTVKLLRPTLPLQRLWWILLVPMPQQPSKRLPLNWPKLCRLKPMPTLLKAR
jgi:hypothetical protein